jgi:hypothetical protein
MMNGKDCFFTFHITDAIQKSGLGVQLSVQDHTTGAYTLMFSMDRPTPIEMKYWTYND